MRAFKWNSFIYAEFFKRNFRNFQQENENIDKNHFYVGNYSLNRYLFINVGYYTNEDFPLQIQR